MCSGHTIIYPSTKKFNHILNLIINRPWMFDRLFILKNSQIYKLRSFGITVIILIYLKIQIQTKESQPTAWVKLVFKDTNGPSIIGSIHLQIVKYNFPLEIMSYRWTKLPRLACLRLVVQECLFWGYSFGCLKNFQRKKWSWIKK